MRMQLLALCGALWGAAFHANRALDGSNATMRAQAADPLARGRASFDRVCGRCHPHGNADVGRRLVGLGWSEDRVRTQVRRGRGTMRPISTSRMSDAQLADAMVYLRSIGTVR